MRVDLVGLDARVASHRFESRSGATAVANLVELTIHLRGQARARQVKGAKVGLAKVIGLGTACTIQVLAA